MTFTIHITSRHVEGAGLHNEYYERIEPCDEDIEIEVDDDQVYDDVVEMICNDYFIVTLRKPELVVLKKVLRSLLSDLDVLDAAVEMYHDALQEKYEDEYDGD